MKINWKILGVILLFLCVVCFIAGRLSKKDPEPQWKPVIIKIPDQKIIAYWDSLYGTWPRKIVVGGETTYVDTTTKLGDIRPMEFTKPFKISFTIGGQSYYRLGLVRVGLQGLLNYITLEIQGDSIIAGQHQPQQALSPPSVSGIYVGAGYDFEGFVDPEAMALLNYKRLLFMGRGGLYSTKDANGNIIWQPKGTLGAYFKIL